ncbi:unnamed protein product [Linum trigynum]|uniref:Uncharacterized protein n=1 Tax=Linum trigynum TaxID=586398 RepID=A0AAV2GV55_9ROSI
MAGSEVHDDAEKQRGRDPTPGARSKGTSSTRDPLKSLERRVSRMEVKLSEDVAVMEDLGANFTQIQGDVQSVAARVMSLEVGNEGLRDELMVLIKDTISTAMNDAIEVMKEVVAAEVTSLKEEVAELKSEVTLVKRVMANGPAIAQPASNMEIPRPKSFQGSRNARELENFLWSLEQYFGASGIRDECLFPIMVVTPAGVPPVVPGSTGTGHKTGVTPPV